MISFDINPPLLNTLHEVFHETRGCKLLSFIIQQDNTPTDSEEIDVVLTRDGTVTTYDSSVVDLLADATAHAFYLGSGLAILTAEEAGVNVALFPPILQNSTAPYRGDIIEGVDMKVEVRQTSPIEAGARIRVNAWIQTPVAV